MTDTSRAAKPTEDGMEDALRQAVAEGAEFDGPTRDTLRQGDPSMFDDDGASSGSAAGAYDRVGELRRQADEFVRTRPWDAVLFAAITGLAVGLLARR